jgi:hypothetical protein
MNKKEIAETLRTEIGAMEALLKKLKVRSDRLKKMLFDLEAEDTVQPLPIGKSILDGKFRKAIDSVFGEKPKRSER